MVTGTLTDYWAPHAHCANTPLGSRLSSFNHVADVVYQSTTRHGSLPHERLAANIYSYNLRITVHPNHSFVASTRGQGSMTWIVCRPSKSGLCPFWSLVLRTSLICCVILSNLHKIRSLHSVDENAFMVFVAVVLFLCEAHRKFAWNSSDTWHEVVQM